MPALIASGEEITVEIEFGGASNFFLLNDAVFSLLNGVGKLDGEVIRQDVSDYCQSISISRGRQSSTDQTRAGSCSVVLLNNDRRFDPINEDSPYWDAVENRSGISPRRKIDISSNNIPIFSGLITDINLGYENTISGVSYDLSTVEIAASDNFVLLANAYIDTAYTPSEQLSGARVQNILDLGSVNYPLTSRNISTGSATLGGGATFEISANTNALQYLQNVAISEDGYFYVSADGTLTFTDRVTASFAGVEAIFSDDGTNLPYSQIGITYGQEELYNKIICTIVDGVEQVADNTDSQDDFGISTLSLTDLLLSTNASALALANNLLERYGLPQYRFDGVATYFNGLNSSEQQEVASLDLADIVQIVRNYNVGSPLTVTKYYAIESIKHSISPSSHSVELGLGYVDLLFAWTFDDLVLGIIDSNNAVT